MDLKYLLFFILVFLLNSGCHENPSTKSNPLTIYVQPFTGLPKDQYEYVYTELQKVYPHVALKKSISLPAQAYVKERNRYRADTIIRWLRDQTPVNSVTIGLTGFDISTTKDNVKDWGVMGLGYRPGRACVASAFRLNKEQKLQQFFKVSIHELGHTQGLDHCEVKICFMRDAEGRNPTNEEVDFCESCKRILVKKGWAFQ